MGLFPFQMAYMRSHRLPISLSIFAPKWRHCICENIADLPDTTTQKDHVRKVAVVFVFNALEMKITNFRLIDLDMIHEGHCDDLFIIMFASIVCSWNSSVLCNASICCKRRTIPNLGNSNVDQRVFGQRGKGHVIQIPWDAGVFGHFATVFKITCCISCMYLQNGTVAGLIRHEFGREYDRFALIAVTSDKKPASKHSGLLLFTNECSELWHGVCLCVHPVTLLYKLGE